MMPLFAGAVEGPRKGPPNSAAARKLPAAVRRRTETGQVGPEGYQIPAPRWIARSLPAVQLSGLRAPRVDAWASPGRPNGPGARL
jgi:hypothetical protein